MEDGRLARPAVASTRARAPAPHDLSFSHLLGYNFQFQLFSVAQNGERTYCSHARVGQQIASAARTTACE